MEDKVLNGDDDPVVNYGGSPSDRPSLQRRTPPQPVSSSFSSSGVLPLTPAVDHGCATAPTVNCFMPSADSSSSDEPPSSESDLRQQTPLNVPPISSAGDNRGGDGGAGDKGKKLKGKVEKRKTEQRFAFKTKSEVDLLDDGFRWRKYGQKPVKNSPFPRSYYRCTAATCGVKKMVERSSVDPSVIITTYEGRHFHPTTLVSHPMPSEYSLTAYGSHGAGVGSPLYHEQQFQQPPMDHSSSSSLSSSCFHSLLAAPDLPLISHDSTSANSLISMGTGLLEDMVSFPFGQSHKNC